MESAATTQCNGAREWKTFQTNWTSSGGSLDSSVTVESSSSSTSMADEDVQSESSKRRSPVVLSPPSPGSNPCEITITFTGRYEVRQVYVRSTARVYEIYYKTKVQNHNEYLCTVRCGIAAKDTCATNGIIDDCLTSIRDSDDHPSAEERAKTEGHSNAGEDDWVEVKAPSATCIAEKNNSTGISLHKMDFYEATAQIADADPCVSLTIRLASIQSGEFVYVDEVYVFCDPVDSDLESQDGKVENSVGSSLMAMLVPTLLQLSKRADSTNVKDDKHSYDLVNKKQLSEMGSGSSNLNMHPRASALSNTTKGSEDGPKYNTTDHHKAQAINFEPTQQITQNPLSGTKLDHIEEILKQLASRIVRIEDICLRFEEKMLKPISSIEARLQSVEQQLEMLNDKSQKGLQNCNKFSAPECSFSESNINSLLKGVTCCHDAVESDKDSSDGSSTPVDDVHISASTSQLVPSLSIAAPIFSDDENEEERIISEQKVDSPERNSRPAVSLDDALASALAGFMSSTVHFKEFAQPPTVNSLDVQNEADDIYEQQASPKNRQSEATDFCAHLKGADGKEHEEGSATSTNEAFLERFDYYNHSEEVALESIETQPLENGKYNVLQTEGDITSDAAKEEAIRVELNEGEEANPESNQNLVDGVSGTPISVSSDATLNDTKGTILQQDIKRFDGLPKMTTERSNSAESSCELLAADKTVASSKLDGPYVEEEAAQPSSMLSVPVMKSKSEADISENVFIFSQPASAVDFNIPILDVKFISQGISNKSSLEALLSDMPESNTTSPCDEHCHDACAYEEQPNLIVVDDADPSMCATDSNLTMNLDYDDLEEIPAGDTENLQANFACGYKELLSGSLI